MSEPVRPPSSERARAERKLATILFADLVSSTELGASQDPERTRALLERFYDAMAEEISEAGGTVEKFAGDAVMAAFGVPAAQEDHVERALHAALAMQRRMQELFAGTLALRIGVNSGEVVVGAARESSSFVTGDVVNVAARLEQAAEAGVVLVGERAVSLVAGAFEFGPTMRVPAKGKPEGVECRRLVRALSLMRARGVPGLKRVFVGRERELRLVEEAYGRARSERTPQLVTIIGEPGLGKTRLVREVWEWLGLESPAALRRTGRCPPYGRARTYAPIGEILTEHFGILASDPPERVLAQLGERTILALALGLDVAGELHPIEARDRLHDAWIELVAGLSADRPLAMLVEDLHWAEEPLLNLLERTLLEVEAPVLLLATGRPEFLDRSPTWGRRGRVSSEWVWLEPLAPDEVDRWLAEVAEDPPPTVRAELARAEGNPLFLEEVLGTLIERGVLRDDGWNDAAPAAEANVPGTIQAVLQARIDLLPAPEKGALKAAAVIGRVFWASAVHELLEGGWPDFGLLEQRDFVRRRPGSSLEGEREFVFKHALTRDVGYASLTMRERAHMHAAFAAWLERRGGGRDEDAAVLAHHFAEAVRPEEVDLAWLDEPERLRDLRASAVRWLGRAAELAARRHESEDAVAMLDLALGLVDSESTRIEVLTTRAKICELHYDVEGFRASVEEALELGPEPATAAWIYARLASFTLARRYMWRHPPPLELGRQWLAKALELAEPGSSARGYALVAQALSAPLGNEEAAAEANAIGEAIGDVALVVLSMQARTHAATNTGQFQEAGAWAERTLARKTLGDPTPGAQEFYAAFAYARAGWPAKARQLEELSSETMASFSRHEAVHAFTMRALIQTVYGEWRDLGALASRAEAVSAANDSHPCQFNWRNLLVVALGLAHVGDEREARRLEELGRSTAVVNGPPEREPTLLRLALLRGDEDEMRRILEVLPATGDGWCVDNAPARLDALLAVGEWERVEDEAAPFLREPSYIRPFALRALGVCRGDASLVREAEAFFATMGLEWRAEETRSLLSGPRGAFRAVTNPSRRGDPPAR